MVKEMLPPVLPTLIPKPTEREIDLDDVGLGFIDNPEFIESENLGSEAPVLPTLIPRPSENVTSEREVNLDDVGPGFIDNTAPNSPSDPIPPSPSSESSFRRPPRRNTAPRSSSRIAKTSMASGSAVPPSTEESEQDQDISLRRITAPRSSSRRNAAPRSSSRRTGKTSAASERAESPSTEEAQQVPGISSRPNSPKIVNCHKGSKCNHYLIYDNHYNKQVWDKYQDWCDSQKKAGYCPHCGQEVKLMPKKKPSDSLQKQKEDSVQSHKINQCKKYPYGKRNK